MAEKLQLWWQRIKQRRVAIIVITAIIVMAIALIIIGYLFDWSGFNGYTQVSTIHTVSGPMAGTITRTEALQPGKSLWDWLQLLIIPVVLAIAGYAINFTVSNNEQKSTQLRDQTERDITTDNQREAALQAYIDKMSELLLERDLRRSAEDDEVRKITRVRTLTVLTRLDANRKRSVLEFLYEFGLINKLASIIDLERANLRSRQGITLTMRGM